VIQEDRQDEANSLGGRRRCSSCADYRSDRLNEACQNGLRRLAEVTGINPRAVPSSRSGVHPNNTTIDSHYSVGLLPPQRTAKSVAELGLARQ
jgi:hypothetical protein